MKELVRFFGLQFVYYFVATWNFRVIAQAHYASILVSDVCLATVSFTLIQRISKSESNTARAGFVLGGASGSLLAAWITKTLYGA